MTTAIDWESVEMTPAARNTQKPDTRMRVIEVAREIEARAHGGGEWSQWADLELAAAGGVSGLRPLVVLAIDAPQPGFSLYRAGDSRDRLLRGRSLLFRQGW